MQNNLIINHKKYQLKKNERGKKMSDFDRCNVHMIIKKAKD